MNDYLVERDADLMAPIYKGLGLTVGCVVHGLSAEERRRAYGCNVTYVTNKEADPPQQPVKLVTVLTVITVLLGAEWLTRKLLRLA